MAKRSAAVAGPVMQPRGTEIETPTTVVPTTAVKGKPGWCKFKAKQRCYITGCQLDPDQEITMSPKDSYEQRTNKNLELVAGTIPTAPVADESSEEVDELEDGDPLVGRSPEGFRLVRPA